MATTSVGFPRTTATTPPNPINPVNPAGQPTDSAPSAITANAPTQSKESSASNLRSQQNTQILQASMDVSIQSGNSSLTLLYRTAIDRINEFLAPELGPNAIGATDAPDGSPEATAGRILSLSTAFYDAFAAQAKNKDKDPDTLARDFVSLIRGGFERGFGEAKDILGGLQVLGADSPVEQGINKTYALVMKGFDDFLVNKLTKPADTNLPPANESKTSGGS